MRQKSLETTLEYNLSNKCQIRSRYPDTKGGVQSILDMPYRETVNNFRNLDNKKLLFYLEELNGGSGKINFSGNDEKKEYVMRYILSSLFKKFEISDRFIKEKKGENHTSRNSSLFGIGFMKRGMIKENYNELIIYFKDLTVKEIKVFFENI